MTIKQISPIMMRAFGGSIASVIIGLASSAYAADGTWTNLATGGFWSNTANWQDGTIADNSGFTANFNTLNITSDNTVHLDSDRTLTSLIFGDTTTSSAGGWLLDNNGGSTNNLILAGTTPTITVNALGSGKSATITAIIEGTAGLVKDGAGTLSLSAVNTFTSGLAIKAGTVSLGNASSAGANTITLGDSSGSTAATLTLAVGANTTWSNPVVLGATSGTLTISNGQAYNATLSGGVTGANNLTLAATSGINYNNVITVNSLNIAGTVTATSTTYGGVFIGSIGGSVTSLVAQLVAGSRDGLTLTGANPSFIGDTTLATGKLYLQNINSLQNSVLKMNGGSVYFGAPNQSASGLSSVTLGGLSGSGNINLNNTKSTPTAVDLTLGNSNASYGSNTLNPTYSGVLSSANGAASLTKVGINTQTLTGASTYTGATTVNNGTLELGGANGSLASTALNLGGGTFSYTRTGITTQAFTTTTATVGLSAIRATTGSTLTLGTLASTGGTVDIGNTGTITTSTANTPNGFIGNWATFNNGATWAVANGASAITGFSAYTLTSVAGTSSNNYLNADIDVDSSEGTLDGVITPNSLRFNTASACTVTLATGTNTITSGGILVTPAVGANLSTITGGALNGAASASLNIVQNNTAGGLTINSIIADNGGATGLAKAAAGLLTLTGSNTYTGPTSIAGTLTVGGAGVLGSGTYAANITNNGAFVYSSSAAQGISGIISGPGSVTKDTSSSGTLNLSGANTFTGGLFVKAGTVQLSWGNNTALSGGNGAITLGDGGAASVTLGMGGSTSTTTYNNPIILNGNSASQLNVNFANINMTSAGSVSGTGNLIINDTRTGGSLAFGAGGINHIGTITNNGGTATVTINGAIGSNVTGVTQNSGTLSLSAANTYTGTTRVSGGTLQLTGVGTASGGEIINDSLLYFYNAGTRTVTNLISGSGGLTIQNSTVTLASSNTFQGIATLVSASDLVVNSINSVSNNAVLGTLHSLSSNLGAPVTVANGTIRMGNTDGTGNPMKLTYTGTGEITDRVLALNGGLSTVEQAGSGLLKFVSNLTSGLSTKNLVLQGSTSGTGEIAGNIVNGTGANTLTKAGTGTWTLSGSNTYKGSTTVSSGTLFVSNTSGSGTGFGDVSVATNATLGGIGMITGTVTVASGGILSPGTNSVGTLTVGSLKLSTNATFVVEISGTSSYDSCVVSTGTLDIASSRLSLTVAPGYVPKFHATFTIIRNVKGDAVTGTFANGATISVPGLASPFEISTTGGVGGNDVVLRYTGGGGTMIRFM